MTIVSNVGTRAALSWKRWQASPACLEKTLPPRFLRRRPMKRTALILMTLVALIGFSASTAQAGTTTVITSGIVSQTLAKPHHHRGGRHYGSPKHHGGYRHLPPGRHHGYRHPPVVHVRPRAVVVRPYVYRDPYLLPNGFYYSGRDFSFGFGF